MTKKQEREHKIGNQLRKKAMLARNKKPMNVPVHVIQNGKHTPR